MGDPADASYCLPPGMFLDDLIEKFKWLYGSVESFGTLMQGFYSIIQGKSKRVRACVLHLERALKVIKQQHPHAMTGEEGKNHLKDRLFHGLRHNIHNALCYKYDKPDSQYSKLVMAASKVETEILGGGVSEARAKSAVVKLETQPKVASSEQLYETIMQQITYLMSAIINQKPNTNGQNGPRHNNGGGKFTNTKTQRPKKDRKDMLCWGCGGTRHRWREGLTPREGNNLPFRLAN